MCNFDDFVERAKEIITNIMKVYLQIWGVYFAIFTYLNLEEDVSLISGEYEAFLTITGIMGIFYIGFYIGKDHEVWRRFYNKK